MVRGMSTEVTPESLRAHAAFLRSRGVVEFEVVIWDRWADRLEHEQQPLPTVPGWYPGVVVERGGESCTGALLTDDEWWLTARTVAGVHTHALGEAGLTIRWAERDAEHDAWQSAENALNAAVDELRAAEADVAHWREQFRLVCDESKERTTERDAALTNARTWEDLADGWRDRSIELRGEARQLRDELHKANAEVYRLRATHTEAARGRCARED